MDLTPIVEKVKQDKLAGRRYEREGHGKFRDRITVCRNGRIKFERFCYGEAASLTCAMWANSFNEDGIQWDYDSTSYTDKTEAPVKLTAVNGDALQFDDKRLMWMPEADLKSVPGSGVSRLQIMLGK